MQHLHSLQAASAQSAWLTIGSFDGLHLGHQQILKELTTGAHAQSAPAVVLTFEPHPAEELRGPLENFYLSDPAEKIDLFAELGVDILISHPFDKQVRNTPARQFVELMYNRLKPSRLWVGHDFALGRNRQGDFDALSRMGAELGFSVQRVEPVLVDGELVSSSAIRRLLTAGDAAKAASLLGRLYNLSGTVVRGAQRGRGLGIPTANLQVSSKRLVPANGVYVTWAWLSEHRQPSVTNVGLRPTFEDGAPAPVVETHLLDYSGDEFYNQPMKLEFVSRLRGERKFAGVDELVRQIHADVEQARAVLT